MSDNPFLSFGQQSGGVLRDPNAKPPKATDPFAARIKAGANTTGYPPASQISQKGAPASVRAAVASVQKNSDQEAALKRYYPTVMPYGNDNFIFRDPKNGNKWTIFNPPGVDRGDFAANGRLAANIVGGIGGAALGALTAPVTGPAGALVGGATGGTAGGVLYDKAVQAVTGAKDTRTTGEQVLDAGIETGIGVALPAVGGKVLKAGRNLLRTGEQEIVDAAARQGIRAPAAVTGSKGVQMASGAMEATVTSSGRLGARNAEFVTDMGRRVKDVASKSGIADKTAAGKVVADAADRTVSAFRAESSRLYDEVDRLIPADSRVGIANLETTVDKLLGRFSNNPEWEDVMTDPLVKQIKNATDISVAKGGIDYGLLKDLRSRLGAEIGRKSGKLIDAMGLGETKLLFRALTDDLELAAEAVAGTPGKQAATAANTYWREGRQLIDDFIEPVMKQGGSDRAPEKVYDLFLSRATETPSVLDKWGKVLTPTEREALGRFQVGRLGNGGATAEGALVSNPGDATFNPSAFSRNYNKLFNGEDKSLTRDFFFPNKGVLADASDIFTIAGGAKAAGTQNNASRTAAVTGLTSTVGGIAAAAPALASGAASAGDLALTGGLGVLAWPALANPLARFTTSKTGERILQRPALDSALPELTRLLSPTEQAALRATLGESVQAPFRQEENAPTDRGDENPFLLFGAEP